MWRRPLSFSLRRNNADALEQTPQTLKSTRQLERQSSLKGQLTHPHTVQEVNKKKKKTWEKYQKNDKCNYSDNNLKPWCSHQSCNMTIVSQEMTQPNGDRPFVLGHCFVQYDLTVRRSDLDFANITQ